MQSGNLIRPLLLFLIYCNFLWVLPITAVLCTNVWALHPQIHFLICGHKHADTWDTTGWQLSDVLHKSRGKLSCPACNTREEHKDWQRTHFHHTERLNETQQDELRQITVTETCLVLADYKCWSDPKMSPQCRRYKWLLLGTSCCYLEKMSAGAYFHSRCSTFFLILNLFTRFPLLWFFSRSSFNFSFQIVLRLLLQENARNIRRNHKIWHFWLQ